jgi:hypothetical protein
LTIAAPGKATVEKGTGQSGATKPTRLNLSCAGTDGGIGIGLTIGAKLPVRVEALTVDAGRDW